MFPSPSFSLKTIAFIPSGAKTQKKEIIPYPRCDYRADGIGYYFFFRLFPLMNEIVLSRIYYTMKKLALYLLFIFGGLFIPTIATILISGNMGVADRKMGITVEMKNGEKMDGEQFVIGMAASELSYIKEEEALKAWMIVCRTNFVKAASGENSSKNAAATQNEGNVADVANIGIIKNIKQKNLNLDYVSMKELEENNGRKAYLEIKKKLEDASDATFGQVLTYENKYADALYHEVSIGKTVSSEEIYSVAVPYLISVDSSQDVESSDYMDVKILPYDEVLQKLIKADKNGRLEKIDKKQNIKILKSSLKITKHTDNGFVQEIMAQDNKWTGEEWKKIFGLNSTNFYLENYNGKLRMVTVGKGHDMGMSLYGANALAEKQITAATILSYYYPGTKVVTPDLPQAK